MDIKEAIKELESLSPSELAVETVLSILKEKDKESHFIQSKLDEANAKIIEKDKIIDAMAEQLAGLTIWDNEKEEPLIFPDIEDVKQYFERKVEDDFKRS